MTTKRRASKGISLVEASIVMGVVGLIVGSIWVAAYSVRQNMLVTQLYNGIVKAAQLVKPQITSEVMASVTNDEEFASMLISAALSKIDGFDREITDDDGNPALSTPLGSPDGYPSALTLTRGTLNADPTHPSMGEYSLTLSELPRIVCLNLLARFRTLIVNDPEATFIRGLSGGDDGPPRGSFLTVFANAQNGATDNTPLFDNEDDICQTDRTRLVVSFPLSDD